ncbi:hypothetical protein [Solibacillus isronensis]|uniref:hypothetical protein n=1 Tax=Solibacillus isronensis TaxID=412383 RepID=UPI0009A74A3F|nr:hypothetical protein [Solibacillus isronensis]
MKDTLQRVVTIQQDVQKKIDGWIQRLSRSAIEQEERRYELMYGKPLSEKEIIEIKKGVVVRYAMILIVPVLVIVLTVLNQGVM